MHTQWHLRTRAVVYQDGKFLVVSSAEVGHTFLVGGHVEEGESVPAALAREIMEETGRKCEVKEYLGAIENAWTEGDTRHWEITHFFNVDIDGVKGNPELVPAEKGFDLEWLSPDEFETRNLLPVPLRGFMKRWASGDRSARWGSTME